MPAVLIVLLIGALTAGVLGVNSSDIGLQSVREGLAQQHLTQSYQAAQTGLREAIAFRFAYSTNKLNFITPASGQTPYNPLSGWIHTDPGSPSTGSRLAAYQFMAFGGAPERNASGSFDSSRADVYDSALPVYVTSRGTTCLDDNNNPTSGNFTVDGNGYVDCSSGTETTVTLLAKLDMSGTTNSIEWTRVFTGNDTMTTDEQVFVPGYGYVTSFNFDTAWLGGSTRTTQAGGLYRIAVDNDGTVSSYDVTGQNTVSLPDGSYSTRFSETDTEIKFIFNGAVDFRTLYPTSDYDDCFGDAADQCNIQVTRDGDASPNHNAKIYPVFPLQNQVVIDAAFPNYTHSSSSSNDSQYKITIPSNTVYDWYGNAVNAGVAFNATLKVDDPVAPCSVAEAVTISSAAGSPFTYNDPEKIYTITIASGVTGVTVNMDNTCGNIVNLTNGTNDSITINNGTSGTLTVDIPSEGNDEITIDNDNTAGGSLTVNLPGESGAYTTSGSSPTHYDMDCEDADVYITGQQSISYGSYNCGPDCSMGYTHIYTHPGGPINYSLPRPSPDIHSTSAGPMDYEIETTSTIHESNGGSVDHMTIDYIAEFNSSLHCNDFVNVFAGPYEDIITLDVTSASSPWASADLNLNGGDDDDVFYLNNLHYNQRWGFVDDLEIYPGNGNDMVNAEDTAGTMQIVDFWGNDVVNLCATCTIDSIWFAGGGVTSQNFSRFRIYVNGNASPWDVQLRGFGLTHGDGGDEVNIGTVYTVDSAGLDALGPQYFSDPYVQIYP
jgi:hypothetical protein